MTGKVQTCPYSPQPKIYGANAQAPMEHDSTPTLDDKGITQIANHWQHFMLSTSGGYDGHNGCKFFGSRANKSNQTNTQEMRVTS